MEYDTGAALTLITKKTYERIRQRNYMEPFQDSDVQLRTYTGQLVPLLGATSVNVECGEKQDVTSTCGRGTKHFGRDWITAFKAFKVDFGLIDNLVGSNQLQVSLEKHSSVFNNEIGTLKGIKMKLHVDPNVKPKFFKARSVPYSLREKVETELGTLESTGLISPVQFCDWAASIVPVMKSNGTIRICGDFKVTINSVSQVDTYPLPRVKELFSALSGRKYFSKLDMSQAYLQLELENDSKQYATVSTHKGLFQYNRLPFGVSSALSIFQRYMETLLQGCKGVSVYLDDIFVTGGTAEDHMKNQSCVKLDLAGARLNKAKCSFMVSQIEYLGHVTDKDGLHPTEEKIQAIKDAPRPTNVTELRAFLGVINYYGKFMLKLSTQLSPLYMLLCKESKWVWTSEQDHAFVVAKGALQANSLLVHYDSSKPLVVGCDASQYGLGAVLSHVMEDGSERPVAYASRTLSSAEKIIPSWKKKGWQ